MVTLSTADNALKALYLSVVSDQLNTNTNPLFNRFKQTESDVWGKEIIKLAPYGVNGGIGAGTETDTLPKSAENRYAQFKLSLKNLYGAIEISDKAIRASANNAGAFVNLLNAEMDGLIKASKFNFGRMLFGDGSGKLATVVSATGKTITLDTIQYLMEGMVIDVCSEMGVGKSGLTTRRIVAVDRANKKIVVDGADIASSSVTNTDIITVQGSFNNEITGLGAIFGNSQTLYSIDRANNAWLKPYNATMANISDMGIQTAIDELENVSGSSADFICCSYGVRRAYQDYLRKTSYNVNSMELEGGYKAISFNGIPLVADRFVAPKTMYILNTAEFSLHQLCDWRWLEGEDGKVLKQVASKPIYTATLVKYADLICNKPSGQAVLTGITEA
ncbi:MAG: phage major capsid protein [Clostridia bacterium]